MNRCLLSVALLACALQAGAPFAAAADKPTADASASDTWSPTAAAKYLDQRAAWWESWPKSQRDHETVCVSCHTILPYVLSRPKLSSALNEKDMPAPERTVMQNLQKRVAQWADMQPYYLDEKAGPGKSKASRSTESVLNALILANRGAGQKHLDPLTRTAFNSAWALQFKSGPHAGAWDWQVFKLAPWEAGESQYQGATFMALAVGLAPSSYRHDPAIQENLRLLRGYLRREYASQPLLNRVVVLWASGKFPGLLSGKEKHELVATIIKQQQPDGGWSLASLGTWTRSDHTPQETASDGYATGVVTLALKEAKARDDQNAWMAGRNWLEHNQNKEDGSWRADSVNKKRDPSSDVGRFMRDAATGYAVMALEATR